MFQHLCRLVPDGHPPEVLLALVLRALPVAADGESLEVRGLGSSASAALRDRALWLLARARPSELLELGELPHRHVVLLGVALFVGPEAPVGALHLALGVFTIGLRLG